MVFNSVVFVYFFLPLVTGVFYLLHKWPRVQNLWLLAAGFFFYSWCNIQFLVFLLIFGCVNYCFGLLLGLKAFEARPTGRKIIFVVGTSLNIISLFVVKYLNFSINIINVFTSLNIDFLSSVFVPLGISFLVFTAVSYLVDVYQKKTEPLLDPIDFFLYISFFPKLSQGPITRCEQMRPDLRGRYTDLESFSAGFRRFCFGLAKKVLIADTLGATVDLVYSTLEGGIPILAAWAGILCYTFQIYFDFSGYTDMAIGLGTIFGFHLPENFNAPYLSRSVSEFWRRWHMTLGAWFRDYLYIPLGGNRCSKLRNIFNLAVVWFLTGLWHGASFNYILWGVFLGAVIIFEKLTGKTKWYLAIPEPLKWFGTFLTVMFGWVLFRSGGLTSAAHYFMAMFGMDSFVNNAYGVRYFMDNGTLIALAISIVLTVPQPERWRVWISDTERGVMAQNAAAIILFAISLLFLVNSTYSAFIYFQF